MVDNRFSGQAAVVTGGADGIGKAIAHRLLLEGAAVTLFDVDEKLLDGAKEDFSAKGLTANTSVVDVCLEEQVRAAFELQAKLTAPVDIVVHCAGIVGPNGKPITDVDTVEFDRVYQVNVRGTFLLIKHAIVAMKKRNYGRILAFSSIAGKEGNAGMCAYSTSKAAVIGLVKSVGKEFAETGITVNAIAPAVIRTALVEKMTPPQVEYMTSRIPMKRCGTLEEIAALSCWIVSKEASFTTGFTFDLSGGRATY